MPADNACARRGPGAHLQHVAPLISGQLIRLVREKRFSIQRVPAGRRPTKSNHYAGQLRRSLTRAARAERRCQWRNASTGLQPERDEAASSTPPHRQAFFDTYGDRNTIVAASPDSVARSTVPRSVKIFASVPALFKSTMVRSLKIPRTRRSRNARKFLAQRVREHSN